MIARLNNMIPPTMPGFDANGVPPLNMNFGNPSPFGTTNNFSPMSNLSTTPTYPQNQNISPISMPEIRTEADLAVFNQFMMSLGRDVAGQTQVPAQPMVHNLSFDGASGASSSPHGRESPIEDLFNPDELASLGLANMPGMANINNLTADMSTLPSQFGHLYPSLPTLDQTRPRAISSTDIDFSKRPIAGLPRANSLATNKLPTFTTNNNNTTYGTGPGTGLSQYLDLSNFHVPAPMSNNYPTVPMHDFSSFDSLARSKNPMPAATMAPRDFYKKTYRHVDPLGAAVSSRRSIVQESSERTEIRNDGEDDEVEADTELELEAERERSTPKISVQSLLLSDEDADPSLKLPAIADEPEQIDARLPSLHDSLLDVYRSSPVPSSSTSSRRSTITLTSSLDDDLHPPAKRHTEDDIVRGVKRLELSDHAHSPAPSSDLLERERRLRSRHHAHAHASERDSGREMRKRHTALIKAWIIAVNVGFQRRLAEEAASEKEEGDLPAVDEEGDMDEEDNSTIGDEEEEEEEEDEEEVTTPQATRMEILA